MFDATVAEARVLDSFRGDFRELSAFMNQSWAENSQQALYYGPSFLKSCLEYPGTNVSLWPTIYKGTAPVAFVAGFPRTATCEGKTLRLVLITFLTVSPEDKKKGYGVMLWSELVSRARAAGFDGMVNYCIAESDMDRMILGCCSRLKLPTSCAHSIGYRSALLSPIEPANDRRLIDSQRVETPQTGGSQTTELFLGAAAKAARGAALSRIWSEGEAEWQCHGRTGSLTSTYSCADRQGVLAGYVAPIANAKRTKCLFVEDVLWSELMENERRELLRDFLAKARLLGAEMATVPQCGYADLKAFSAAGFFRTRRVVRAYLTIWTGAEPPTDLPSFYLDVL